MRLAKAGAQYDQGQQRENVRILERADRENLKRGRDIEMGKSRVILTSPNGTRFAVMVENDGTLSTELV